LGEVCNFIGGGTPSKSNSAFWGGSIPWASIKDIKGDYLNRTQDFITEKGLQGSSANLAFPNEIILCTRINPGKPIITKIKTAINQDLKVVRPKINIHVPFLFYAFKNSERQIVKLSSGTTVLGVSLNNLRENKIPLAPLPEQRAIVSKIEQLFSELDNGVANLKAARDKLEAYRQAVLKKAFEGELTREWREKNIYNQNEFLKKIINDKKEAVSKKLIKPDNYFPEVKEKNIIYIGPSNWLQLLRRQFATTINMQ
jgi:type I restriction enzyme, S subunit